MFGGIYFAAAPFAGLLSSGPVAAALLASAQLSITTTATISPPPPRLEATATIALTVSPADLTVPINTGAGIWIDGVPVTGRVRVQGVTIRDVLNDAPNTATFQIEGDGPAVGQRVRIQMGTRVLFAGAVQTIDQAFESRPDHLIWGVTAVDDTAAANARRPFGTWFETSATTIAEALTTTFAPGFSTAGIAADLPTVSIVFDGADPLIACLARLASAIGGYCKIEDRVVYLFLEDLADPPDPIDDGHRFLMSPPIQINTDSSQLRTRVYGKGYGERVPTDVDAGETLIPIQDGALFPPLGGTAIVGLTSDGAQSDRIAFAGVVLESGGSLVGPGASPTNPPGLALAAGAGVTSGEHTVSVAYRTAAGQSLAGPPATITAGTHPAPATAPTAGTATTGTGPDQGSHDYAVAFVTGYGETLPGPISNPITTSTTVGELPTPGISSPQFATLEGMGVDYPGQYVYVVTFINANGETLPGPESFPVATRLVDVAGVPTPHNRIEILGIPIGPAGTTGRRLYRRSYSEVWPAAKFLTTISNNTATTYVDATPNASLGATPPTSNTTGTAIQRIPVSNIPIGPASVTARKLYRRFNGAGTFKLVTTIANNTGTTFTDGVANAALGAAALGTATAVGNQILVTLPTGAAAVTARELYMSPVGTTVRRLLATIPDNVTTAYTVAAPDSVLTGALEPAADTSGLQQPQGQVNPGATVLPVASSATFRPAGGWVLLGGGQVVRYTGVGGNTLTGIPPAGAGAITTAVLYGQQAIPAPMLTGVTGLARPMLKGSAVHLWIQRDDLLAQAEHAARTGGDGVVEYLVVDQRRGVDSLAALCEADLARFARPILTVGYATRDLKTKSGKTITVNLPSQRLAVTLTIQEVTITEIDVAPGLSPRFTVRASTVRFSLEDTLRRLIAGGQVVGGSV